MPGDGRREVLDELRRGEDPLAIVAQRGYGERMGELGIGHRAVVVGGARRFTVGRCVGASVAAVG